MDNKPPKTNLISPVDGMPNLTLKPTLTWDAVPDALTYQVQVATNPAFVSGTMLFDQTTTATAASVSGLEIARVYYWRVQVENACGKSDFSNVFAFQTGQPECSFDFASANVPIVIPDTSIALVVSNLNVPDGRFVADVNVSLKIDHEWVGDLAARLVAPDGTTALLFEHPGFPALSSGCNGENLDLGLDDEAVRTATELENTCNNMPAISAVFQAV